MTDETPILNREITETLEEILEKNGFSKSSHKILLSILEEIATSDASHGNLQEKINHLISSMHNKGESNWAIL